MAAPIDASIEQRGAAGGTRALDQIGTRGERLRLVSRSPWFVMRAGRPALVSSRFSRGNSLKLAAPTVNEILAPLHRELVGDLREEESEKGNVQEVPTAEEVAMLLAAAPPG